MAHRVMIVEDALIISLHLKKLLEINGYEVVAQFTEAEKAVAHYESNQGHGIDLVFMDIMLDGRMDGIEAARLLQAVRAIPIIYLTALTDQATITRAKETMPYGYLIKPFEEHALLTTLEMAIYKFKAEQEISVFQSRFFLTVNSLNEGVITTDQNFHVEFVNEAARRILEIDTQEILGQGIHSFFQLISQENEQSLEGILYCHISNQSTSPQVISYQTKNGKEKHLGNIHLLPILSQQGQVSGAVITFADVSPHILMANREKEREVLRLSALIEGQEQERGRISRELHDGLGQMLTTMKYSLNALEIPSEKSYQLSRLLDETIHETSRISENLLPSKLKNFDLKTCISSICNSNYLNTSAIINFDCSKENIEVDAVQKIHIYRIAQEAINNALKYAKASMISVQLYILEDQLVLTIEDDGKGFDVKSTMDRTTTKHQGLQNMKDRVEIMRGKIDIDSNEKLGTIISIQIPYAKRHQNYIS